MARKPGAQESRAAAVAWLETDLGELLKVLREPETLGWKPATEATPARVRGLAARLFSEATEHTRPGRSPRGGRAVAFAESLKKIAVFLAELSDDWADGAVGWTGDALSIAVRLEKLRDDALGKADIITGRTRLHHNHFIAVYCRRQEAGETLRSDRTEARAICEILHRKYGAVVSESTVRRWIREERKP